MAVRQTAPNCYEKEDGFRFGGERIMNEIRLFFAEQMVKKHDDYHSQNTFGYEKTLKRLRETRSSWEKHLLLQDLDTFGGRCNVELEDLTVESWDDKTNAGVFEILLHDKFHGERFRMRVLAALDGWRDKILGGEYME